MVVYINDGTIAQRLRYDTFGNVTTNSNPAFQSFGFVVAQSRLWRTSGNPDSSGPVDCLMMIRNWFALAPGIIPNGTPYGVMLRLAGGQQENPLGFAGSMNFYEYVKNDPINFYDPSELRKCKKGFWQRTWDAFKLTHKKLPGLLDIGLSGFRFTTNWAIVRYTNSVSIFRWIGTGLRGATMGASTFTGLETGIVAMGTSALNCTIFTAALEVGFGIGSMIRAAILPCVEEPDPCK